jgi:hypothetical protein
MLYQKTDCIGMLARQHPRHRGHPNPKAFLRQAIKKQIITRSSGTKKAFVTNPITHHQIFGLKDI